MDSNLSSHQGYPSVYPHPPQAVFPSGSKRKRAVIDDSSDAGRSRSRVSSTSDFNNHTKAQVRAQNHNQCWHCGAGPVNVCHVIGSRDNTFKDALAHGLIDFKEKQTLQNAIALCGTCHMNFDHVNNPSFFFLPTDLDYFLTYERKDRRRRQRMGRRTGTIPGRTCPTARSYQRHQRRQGVEGAEAGGLYTRIVLQDFSAHYPGRALFQPGLSEYGATKSWTGSPMASLHRAVIMLRNLSLQGIPLEIRNALRQLQDAYSEELDLDSSETVSQGSIGQSEEDESEEGSGGDSSARSQRSGVEERSVSQTGKREGKGCTGEVRSKANLPFASFYSSSSHEECNCFPEVDYNAPRFWRWGPGATSEDAATFFREVL